MEDMQFWGKPGAGQGGDGEDDGRESEIGMDTEVIPAQMNEIADYTGEGQADANPAIVGAGEKPRADDCAEGRSEGDGQGENDTYEGKRGIGG